MMVMTAKVDIRKVVLILAAVAGVVLALILLLRGGTEEPTAATVAPVNTSSNDSRVQFLKDLGWEVTTSPKESGMVRIPEESTEVFDRYNALQKSVGYDLTSLAGKSVMRYVYKISNYPGATEPVYATILTYKDKIIGGDNFILPQRGSLDNRPVAWYCIGNKISSGQGEIPDRR